MSSTLSHGHSRLVWGCAQCDLLRYDAGRRATSDSQLAEAARAYVAARLANDAAEPKDWTARAAEVDRTWHALLEVSGLSETREETEEGTR